MFASFAALCAATLLPALLPTAKPKPRFANFLTTISIILSNMMRLSQQSALTTALCSPLTSVLPTLLLAAGYTRTRKIESASFAARIKIYSSPRNINRFDRKFLIRPPDLSNKNSLTFPIRMPMRVRHVPKRVKNPIQFTENTSKIRWNRLSPN